MTNNIAAGPATQRLKFDVELEVIHRVTVKIDGDSGQTIDELKQLALAEFHRDPLNNSRRMDRDTWRELFNGRTNISVGSESVAVRSLTSRTVGFDR